MPGELVLMCGRAYSGKSTIAEHLCESLKARIVSLDAINASRGLQGGQGIPIAEWVKTHEVAAAEVRAALGGCETVILDDTSSPRFLRDNWRRLASDCEAEFALVFVDTPLEVILDRQASNRLRPARQDVSDEVMSDHLDGFEPPETDEETIRVDSQVDLPEKIAATVSAALRRC